MDHTCSYEHLKTSNTPVAILFKSTKFKHSNTCSKQSSLRISMEEVCFLGIISNSSSSLIETAEVEASDLEARE